MVLIRAPGVPSVNRIVNQIVAAVAVGFFGLVGMSMSASQAQAQNLDLKPEQLTFRYQQYDGETSLGCVEYLANPDSQDWDVKCADATGAVVKHYVVHLWVTVYHRTVEPKTSYEVLYWITDFSRATPVGAGTTVWFHVRDESQLSGIDVSQSVEDDTAGLYLSIKL